MKNQPVCILVYFTLIKKIDTHSKLKRNITKMAALTKLKQPF